MEEEEYRRVELEKDGMRVILEFPKEPGEGGCVKEEAGRILSHILKEYLEKNSWFETGG